MTGRKDCEGCEGRGVWKVKPMEYGRHGGRYYNRCGCVWEHRQAQTRKRRLEGIPHSGDCDECGRSPAWHYVKGRKNKEVRCWNEQTGERAGPSEKVSSLPVEEVEAVIDVLKEMS